MTLAPANSHGSGYPLGLTGAVSPTRYVGGTASVAPTTGTFAVGDFVITANAKVIVCTVAGSPGTWVQVGASSGSGLLFYTEVTGPVTTTATAEGSAEALVTLGVQTYAAVPTWIEFFCPGISMGVAGVGISTLNDGASELCRFTDVRIVNGGTQVYGRIKITPTAASHTYNIKGFGTNAITWNGGTGAGGAATYAPMYMAASTA